MSVSIDPAGIFIGLSGPRSAGDDPPKNTFCRGYNLGHAQSCTWTIGGAVPTDEQVIPG